MSDKSLEPVFENFENTKNDPWDMPNNFCFHVYAQKSLSHSQNLKNLKIESLKT